MTYQEKISHLLGVLRLAPGEFAKAVGISATGISKLLNGKSEPRLSTLREICKAFPQVNYQWLTTGEGPVLLDIQTKEVKEAPIQESAVITELRALRKEFSNLLNVIQSQQELIRKHTGNRSNNTHSIMGVFTSLVANSVALTPIFIRR